MPNGSLVKQTMLSAMRRSGALLLLAAMMTAWGVHESAAQNRPGICFPRFRFVPNGVVDIQGSTFRNRVCQLWLGVNSSVTDYQLVTRPANGILGNAGEIRGRYQVAYRPNPGFSGQDSFKLSLRYRGPRRTELTTRIRARVWVTR